MANPRLVCFGSHGSLSWRLLHSLSTNKKPQFPVAEFRCRTPPLWWKRPVPAQRCRKLTEIRASSLRAGRRVNAAFASFLGFSEAILAAGSSFFMPQATSKSWLSKFFSASSSASYLIFRQLGPSVLPGMCSICVDVALSFCQGPRIENSHGH